jgi:serine phosphatase RsbU (regulator of sigma subunit)
MENNFREESNKLTKLKEEQDRLQDKDKLIEIARSAGVELALTSMPADGHEVTSDFFRIEKLSDGHLAFFIGDVEGHGAEAAETSIGLHDFMSGENFLQFAKTQKTAAETLQFVNENWGKKSIPEGDSMELSLVLLDPKTGDLNYSSLGGPSLYIKREDGISITIGASSYVMRERNDYLNTDPLTMWKFEPQEYFDKVSQGDIMFLSTDGPSSIAEKETDRRSYDFDSPNTLFEILLLHDEIDISSELGINSFKKFESSISSNNLSRFDDVTVMAFRMPKKY